MAKSALRVYINEISDLIDQGHLEESLAHCRYILEIYPKHIETYRLFGKTYLEAIHYQDAADIFQRVISSVPDDFVSQIGMSIIREDEGNLDSAIYHMERTFESQPSNQAIQEELRRLYGLRDGVEPAKIRLTRGALARMYAHGNLYEQAVAELASALAEDPARIDLSVLMAEMYFKMEKFVEAADISVNILEKLPNNLSANKILFFILKDSNREEEAEKHWQRWVSLDPYVEFMDDDNTDPFQVENHKVTIEKLNWDPLTSKKILKSEAGLKSTNEFPNSKDDEGSKQNWLFAVNSEEENDEDQFFETSELEDSQDVEILDKIDGEGSESVEPEKLELDRTEDSDENIPDWILEGVVETMENDDITANDDVPEMNEEIIKGSGEDMVSNENDSPENELPDWMDFEDGKTESESVSSNYTEDSISDAGKAAESVDDDSDWIKDIDGTDELSPDDPEAIEDVLENSVDSPDWLEELGETKPVVVEEPKDSPDWLKDISGVQEATEDVVEDTPDWLTDTVEDDSKEEEIEETPEWMEDVAEVEDLKEEESEDTPDWMKDAAEVEDSKEEETENAPNWMKDDGDLVDGIEKVESEMPDWLSELDEPDELVEAETAEETKVVETEDVIQLASTTDEGEDADWLNDLDDAGLDDVQEIETDESSTGVDLVDEDKTGVDWLDTLGDDGEKEPNVDEVMVELESEVEVTSTEIEADAPEELTSEIVEEDKDAEDEEPETVADELLGNQEVKTEAITDAETMPEVEAEPDPEMGKWLNSLLEEESDETTEIEEEGDWLTAVSDLPTEEVGQTEVEDEDWLLDLDKIGEDVSIDETTAELAESETEVPEESIEVASVEESEMDQDEVVEEETAILETLEVPEDSETDSGLPTLDSEEAPDWLSSEEVIAVEEPKVEEKEEDEWIPESEMEPEAEAFEPVIEKVKRPKVAKKQLSGDLMEKVKSALTAGEIPDAVVSYKKLINKGVAVDQIIENINDALRKYPLDFNIWQVMGDAYMKDGQLQEALDAYSKAEELL